MQFVPDGTTVSERTKANGRKFGSWDSETELSDVERRVCDGE